MAAKLLALTNEAEPELEQGVLDPEFKPAKNKNVHPKAKKYHDMKVLQEAAKEQADGAHAVLLSAMEQEGLEQYVYKGLIVTVNLKKKCKVKMKGEDNE